MDQHVQPGPHLPKHSLPSGWRLYEGQYACLLFLRCFVSPMYSESFILSSPLTFELSALIAFMANITTGLAAFFCSSLRSSSSIASASGAIESTSPFVISALACFMNSFSSISARYVGWTCSGESNTKLLTNKRLSFVSSLNFTREIFPIRRNSYFAVSRTSNKTWPSPFVIRTCVWELLAQMVWPGNCNLKHA